jgi:ATP-dependent Lon protease
VISSGKSYSPETLENLNYNAAVQVQKEHQNDELSPKTSKVPEVKTEPHQIILKDNQTGISYKKLFAAYLKDSEYITLQDPYIRLPYQFKNLLEFCVMLGNTKNPEQEINLEVVTWNDEEHMADSISNFEELQETVAELGIHLTYRMEQQHDRYIASDNRWKITLGRGLDIFEKIEGRFNIADIDQNRRKCKACEITYLRI